MENIVTTQQIVSQIVSNSDDIQNASSSTQTQITISFVSKWWTAFKFYKIFIGCFGTIIILIISCR